VVLGKRMRDTKREIKRSTRREIVVLIESETDIKRYGFLVKEREKGTKRE
jgi:hypothetical protein